MKFILAAIAAALALGAQPTPVAVAAAPTPITVVTLNVHGSEDRYGDGNGGDPTAVKADVLRLVKTQRPDVVALQELCYRQHRAIRASLAKLGYSATMTYSRQSGGCNDPAGANQFGNALYIKGAISWRASHALPWGKNPAGTPGVEARRMLCATRKDWRQIVCTTHLATRNPDRANQAIEVERVATKWAAGRPYVLAADMNMTEQLTEDAFGMDLAGRSIDWVVARSVSLVAVVAAPSSDHPAIVARVA